MPRRRVTRVSLCTRVEPSIVQRLDEWADYLVVSRNKLVTLALEQLLDGLDERDPEPRVVPR